MAQFILPSGAAIRGSTPERSDPTKGVIPIQSGMGYQGVKAASDSLLAPVNTVLDAVATAYGIGGMAANTEATKSATQGQQIRNQQMEQQLRDQQAVSPAAAVEHAKSIQGQGGGAGDAQFGKLLSNAYGQGGNPYQVQGGQGAQGSMGNMMGNANVPMPQNIPIVGQGAQMLQGQGRQAIPQQVTPPPPSYEQVRSQMAQRYGAQSPQVQPAPPMPQPQQQAYPQGGGYQPITPQAQPQAQPQPYRPPPRLSQGALMSVASNPPEQGEGETDAQYAARMQAVQQQMLDLVDDLPEMRLGTPLDRATGRLKNNFRAELMAQWNASMKGRERFEADLIRAEAYAGRQGSLGDYDRARVETEGAKKGYYEDMAKEKRSKARYYDRGRPGRRGSGGKLKVKVPRGLYNSLREANRKVGAGRSRQASLRKDIDEAASDLARYQEEMRKLNKQLTRKSKELAAARRNVGSRDNAVRRQAEARIKPLEKEVVRLHRAIPKLSGLIKGARKTLEDKTLGSLQAGLTNAQGEVETKKLTRLYTIIEKLSMIPGRAAFEEALRRLAIREPEMYDLVLEHVPTP